MPYMRTKEKIILKKNRNDLILTHFMAEGCGLDIVNFLRPKTAESPIVQDRNKVQRQNISLNELYLNKPNCLKSDGN